jgi:hypothetical protein
MEKNEARKEKQERKQRAAPGLPGCPQVMPLAELTRESRISRENIANAELQEKPAHCANSQASHLLPKRLKNQTRISIPKTEINKKRKRHQQSHHRIHTSSGPSEHGSSRGTPHEVTRSFRSGSCKSSQPPGFLP